MTKWRFTVELERINAYHATIDVEAENLTEARIKAISESRGRPHMWEADIGPPIVRKITSHGAEKMIVVDHKGAKEINASVECPYCHWGIAPSVIGQHIREKHPNEPVP